MRVSGQLQEPGHEAVGVKVLLGHEGHLVEVVDRHGKEMRLAGEELDEGGEALGVVFRSGEAVQVERELAQGEHVRAADVHLGDEVADEVLCGDGVS